LRLLFPFQQLDHGKETDMTLTQTQSRCPHRSSPKAKVKVRPMSERPTSLVPEAKVKEMLRDIAFVLQVTRRLSREIREPKTSAEGVQG
jgi:hypothetical protein